MEQGSSYSYTKVTTMREDLPGVQKKTPARPHIPTTPPRAGIPTPEFREAEVKSNMESTIPWEDETDPLSSREKVETTASHHHHHHSVVTKVATIPAHLHPVLPCPDPMSHAQAHCHGVAASPACLVCRDRLCGLTAPGAFLRSTWCQKGFGHPDRTPDVISCSELPPMILDTAAGLDDSMMEPRCTKRSRLAGKNQKKCGGAGSEDMDCHHSRRSQGGHH